MKSNKPTSYQANKLNEGQLLLEVLVAISAAAAIVAVGAQLVYVSLQSNRSSGERNVALGLMEETFEAVRSVATEKWQTVYKPPDGTGNPVTSKGSANHYKPVQSAGKWTLAAGDDSIAINNITYTRYFTIDNVSRDPTTRNIEATYNSSNDDPSTQKINVTVSWPNADALTSSEYITRWRNDVCLQTNWTTNVTSGVKICPDTTFDGTQSTNIDYTSVPGSIKIQ